MITHIITKSVTTLGLSDTQTSTIEGGAQTLIDEPIPAPSTNLPIEITIDVSQVKSVFIVADQDLTLRTNSSSTPVNTINLKAGVPYTWQSNDYSTLLFTADVTRWFISNATVTPATLKAYILYDGTI